MGSWGKLPGCKMSANGERNSQGTQGTCGKKGKEKEKKIALPPFNKKKASSTEMSAAKFGTQGERHKGLLTTISLLKCLG